MQSYSCIKILVSIISLFILSGCVSSSLEDAAPSDLQATRIAPVDVQQAAVQTPQESASDIAVSDVRLSSQNDNLDENGFPTFVNTPRGEVEQLTTAEKIAIETRMTELLLSRETNENVRANFEAKLRRLRRLAQTHEQNADAIISQ